MTRQKDNEYQPPTYAEIYAKFMGSEYTVGEDTKPGLVHYGDTILVPFRENDKIVGLRPTDWIAEINEDGTLKLMNSDKPTLSPGTRVKIHCPHGARGL